MKEETIGTKKVETNKEKGGNKGIKRDGKKEWRSERRNKSNKEISEADLTDFL